ncbi:MAG: tetratricopeptide repeat protein [bacterium]|jgi:serine/threonine protein kinase/tetratricopeptide (TPR) repeat protein
MDKCPDCGSEIPHDHNQCPECGLTISQGDSTFISDNTLIGPRPDGGAGDDSLPNGHVMAERYEILSVLGKGGMGWVYKAKDREIDRIVALKTIRAEFARDETIIQRFKDEIILARKVTHKNVLRIFDIGDAEGMKFISMPFVDGTDLKSVIQEQGALGVDDTLNIGAQVLQALKAAHDAGVIHRDLKPQNIMIDKDGTVCVADFGIAKSADAGSLTMTGQIIGTPEYMSPEQAEGKEVTFGSDIYSFGLVLYEMLTGDVPFKAESIISTLMLRLREPPPPPSTVNSKVPKWLDMMVMKALEPSVADRYQSADEILADIERQTVTRKFKFKRWMFAAAGAVVVAAVIGFVFWGRSPKLVMEGDRTYLAVLPFENSREEADLDWLSSGIPENLTADLAQSKFFRLMSPERLRQVAAEIGKDISEIGTPDALNLLARATDLDAVVTGSFFPAGDKIRVTMNIQNPADQEIIGTTKVDADEDGILDMIDQLTTDTKNIFHLTQKEIDEDMDRAVGLQRTSSVKAASEFTKGLEHSYMGAYLDAAKSFEAAIEADKDFAMAYAMASESYRNLGHDAKAESLALIAVDKVMRFIDRVPPSDRTFIMANLADITNNPEQAIESYAEFVENYPDDPEGYYKLALAYETISEWEPAAENLRESLRRDPKYGSARFELGKVLIRMNNLDDALPELEAALEFYRNIGNREGEAAVLNALGVLHRRQHQYDLAIDQFEASIAIKEELGDTRGIAASLGNMGTVYEIMGEREKALEVLERSLEIRRQIGDKSGISTALIKIGHIYQFAGKYEQALNYLEESYEIRKVLGAKHLMASSLSDMGTVYSIMGDYEHALEMDTRALELRREIGDTRNEASILRNMAETLMIRGRYEEASANLRQALAIHRELDDTRHLARDYQALGIHCLGRGRVDSALYYLNLALSAQESLDEKPAITTTRSFMGEAYLYKSDYKQALENLEEASVLASSISEIDAKVDVLLTKSLVCDDLGYEAGCDSIYRELSVLDREELSYLTRCQLKLLEARRHRAAGRPAEGIAAAREVIKMAGSGFPRCAVDAMLVSADIHMSEEDYAGAHEVLDDAIASSREHSFRDAEAMALWMSAAVASAEGQDIGGAALCQEAAAILTARGLSVYDCYTVCAGVAESAGDEEDEIEYLTRALDEASSVYQEKCPPRLRHYYLMAKHIPENVSRVEVLLTGAGRAAEAMGYRSRFPLQ